jgi:hypothetical protein
MKLLKIALHNEDTYTCDEFGVPRCVSLKGGWHMLSVLDSILDTLSWIH